MDEWIQHFHHRLKNCITAAEIWRELREAYNHEHVTAEAYKHLYWYAMERIRELGG